MACFDNRATNKGQFATMLFKPGIAAGSSFDTRINSERSGSSVDLSAHLEGIDEGLAGIQVLAVVVVDHVKGARGEGAGVGGAAPHHLCAA